LTFYDNHGRPVAYTEDDETIYLFTGEPVAYFNENTVYGFNGKHLGWFEDGWMRDLHGQCVFFTENTVGSGPIKPIKAIKPIKSVKRVKPVKSVRQIRSLKAIKSLSWSKFSGKQFFYQ
jgi:hypothetical protein